MQPLPPATNPFELNIRSRPPSTPSTEHLTLDTYLTCNPQKISSLHSTLISNNIPSSYLSNDQWILIIELSCNPGCQQQLITQINDYYESKTSKSFVFEKMIRKLSHEGIKIDLFQSPTKVFIKLTLGEAHREKDFMEALKGSVKELDDVALHLTMNGEKVTKVNKNDKREQEIINFKCADLSVKSIASKQLGTALQSLLKGYRIVQYPFLILSQLSAAKINITSTTLERLDELLDINWYCCDFDVESEENQVVQNEFKVWFGYEKQWMSESTVKIDSPSLFLRQMWKNVVQKLK